LTSARRYIVAVSGPTGSGKTALVKGLVARLGDASALHMDDYERMTREPIGDVQRWAERGAHFDELAVPLLGEHLARLKAGHPVRDITPRKYIVFETQFGRAHLATGALIDLLIWIDVPLELALARKLKAFATEALHDANPRDRLAWLDAYLGNYLALVRRLLVMQAERVRPQADLMLDGSGALEPMVARAQEYVLERLR
jgi:uridine kinase